MAEALKDRYFQKPFFEKLVKEIEIVAPEFDRAKFFKDLFSDSWNEKPLKEMLKHSAFVLRNRLPDDYSKALEILNAVVHKFGDFDAMIFPDVVRQFGMGHYEESIEALELYTQYSTAEFAIRPYILEREEETMRHVLRWSTHPSEHVRRLASEGCRPRLPWAEALPRFKHDTSLILPILENLKSDSSLYVRKSVANNWNDLTKDNPKIVLNTFKKWRNNASTETQWIMKHALRGLLKSGDPEALALMGYKLVKVKVENLSITPTQIKVGEKVSFSFELLNMGKAKADLMIDYIIHFLKANGKTAPKVFKLKTAELESGEIMSINKLHNFKLINTRKYYPGKHAIQIQINGEKLEQVEFEILN